MEVQKKKKVIIIIIIALILLIIGILFLFGKGKSADNIVEQKDDEIVLLAEYDEVKEFKNDDYSNVDISKNYLVVKQKDYYGLIDYNGKIVEEIKYDLISYLGDDYYYVEVDGVKTLKRNGNVVADISQYEKGKIYKDNTDEDSLFIMLNENMYNESATMVNEIKGIIRLNDNLRAVYYSKNHEIRGINVEIGSIIYDAITGKIIKNVPGTIIKDNNGGSIYKVYYDLRTYMSKGAYYDSEFNNVLGDNYFYSAQCSNNVNQVVSNGENNKYGYYSINKKKMILPIEYNNIYDVNDNEDLFVVKKNNKFALINDKNNIILAYEYDYINIENGYVFVIKDDTINVYDNNLNSLPNYSFIINKEKEIANIGLCDSVYKYVNYEQILDKNYVELASKLVVSTTEGIKTLLFYDGKVSLYNNDKYVSFEYNDNNKEHYIIITNINNNLVDSVNVYDVKMNGMFDIDLSDKNISLDNNEFNSIGADSIYSVSYDFNCQNFEITYNDNNKEMKYVYYNSEKNELVDDFKYKYCMNLNDKYFYYPVYRENKMVEKRTLFDKSGKFIVDFKTDIKLINNKFLLIDNSKLYSIK